MSETLIVTIESLAAGGDGIAHGPDGRVVFVPRVAPGDQVRLEIVQAKKSFLRGRVTELLQAGDQRVEPQCSLFRDDRCGGCQWQQVSEAGQAAAKQAIVEAALRKLTAAGLELAPILSPAPAYQWRRRARLHWVRPRKAARALVGLYAPGTRRVTELTECPQFEAGLGIALERIGEILAPSLTGKGELELLVGHTGQVHVAIGGPCSPTAAEALAAADGIDGVSLGKRVFGAERIELEPDFSARADDFAQASKAGNEALLEVVAQLSEPRKGTAILELHAGSGNLSRVLALGASRVLAIDRQAPPATLPPGVEYIQGDAVELLRVRLRRPERFELVVLDPPRTGAAELMPPLAKLAPERIVYVSCDPATLARDAGLLTAAGYRAVSAQPIDLMPQTPHVEVVMRFERVSDGDPAGNGAATPSANESATQSAK